MTRFPFTSRTVLFTSLLALTACGGGGGGFEEIAGSTGGTVLGSVQITGGPTSLHAPPQEREPNNHAFQMEDRGDLGQGRLRLAGAVGGADDAADFFRFGVLASGVAEIRNTVGGAKNTHITVYRVRKGQGPMTPIAESEGTAPILVEVETGDHLVVGLTNTQGRTPWQCEVRVAQGITRNVAALPAQTVESAQETITPSAVEVQAAELVVRFSRDADTGIYEAGRAGLEVVSQGGGGYYLVRATRGNAVRSDRSGREALADLAFRLRRTLPDVATIEPNYTVVFRKQPNDALFQNGQGDWHHKLCNTPKAWDTTTGNGVIVAVIDTGVIFEHEDLKPNLLRDGYDFVDNDKDPSDPLRMGASYHGSHVAGIIAAATDNNTGIAGVCWNAKILPIRVLGTDGRGSTFNIAQAILYAAGLPNQSGALPQTKAKVINLSLGGGGYDSVSADACSRAQAAGSILLAAAGNEFQNNNPTSYPANYEGVIGVGSIGPTKQRAPYSNTGSYVDIVAPGGDQTQGHSGGILSTVAIAQGGQFFASYDYMQGTSMACPFAAGVVALMLSTNANLSTADVMNVFTTTSEDLGTSGRDDAYGVGLIDAAKAVQGTNLPVSLDRSSVTFQGASTRETIKVSGNAAAIQLDTNGTASWLQASLSSNTTPADLVLNLDTAALPQGKSSTQLKLVAGNTTLVIQVHAGHSNSQQPQRPASVWIVDPSSQIIAQTAVNAQGQFQLQEVPAGNYQLLFGIDTNQNGTLGDPGDYTGTPLSIGIQDGSNQDVGALQATLVSR